MKINFKKTIQLLIVLLVVTTVSFFSGLGGSAVGYFIFDGSAKNTVERIVNDVQVVDEESAVIDVAEKSSDSVVSIVITKDVPIYENYFNGNSFFPERIQSGTEEQQVGAGTGFIVSDDGLIITNKHVVSDEDASYTVIFNNGEKFEAVVLARDTLLDIAFIKIEASNLKPLNLGSSANIKVGQRVVAIGNSLGEFSNTVSSGIISGLKRDIIAGEINGQNEELLNNVIQTDASINPGNSGGPLLDIKGNVIGVNVAVASNAENIGFAIPIDVVKDLLERFNSEGSIDRPILGVRYIPINETIQKANDLEVSYGALIAKGENSTQIAVIPGSPADKAGLLENDIILEVDGVKIDSENSLITLIQEKRYGDTVTLKVLSKGKEKTISVILEKF